MSPWLEPMPTARKFFKEYATLEHFTTGQIPIEWCPIRLESRHAKTRSLTSGALNVASNRSRLTAHEAMKLLRCIQQIPQLILSRAPSLLQEDKPNHP